MGTQMSGYQSLDRGLAILDLLDRAMEPMGIREIARELKLSPTIVQRLANTLSQSGFIEQVLETRRYKLGYRAMLLGGTMRSEDRLMASADKELRLLADKHLLNGYLGVLRDNKIVYAHGAKQRSRCRPDFGRLASQRPQHGARQSSAFRT